MARGRMIDKRLCKSKKFAGLKSDRSRVLYVLIYTHADCEGKYTADPEEIKVDCCPYLSYSVQRIAESIIELADAGLIVLYESDQKAYLKFRNFGQFQIGIRLDREAPSVIPNPDQVQTNSGVTPSLYLRLRLSLKKEGKKEEKKETYFDSKSGQFVNITEEIKARWKIAYPACDINLCILQAAEWLISNPTRIKSNYQKFLTNWLKREQDRGGTSRQPAQGPAPGTWLKKFKEKEEAK